MNNEPVAWMLEQEINGLAKETVFLTYRPWNENAIPLYTHPTKTLTDEEMYQLASECGFNVDGKAINDGIETAADFHEELFNFAKAILRKTQEK